MTKPTEQEIEYEKKQFMLALMDRRLQLLGTLCQPHVLPLHKGTVENLVKEACDALHLNGYAVENGLPLASVTNVVNMPTKTEAMTPKTIAYSLAIVVTQDETTAVRRAMTELGVRVMVFEHNRELGLERLLIGAQDVMERNAVHRELADLIARKVVTFDPNLHIEMTPHKDYCEPVTVATRKAHTAVDNEPHKD